MRRREFMAGLGGVAATWPLAAQAQQPSMPVVGLLFSEVPVRPPANWVVFRGLSEMGYVEGRNVTVEIRGADQYDQLLALAADLVRRKVAVIVAMGANATRAAKAATTTIPIVFANGSDPIRVGIVPSLSRPGGNITGVTFFISELAVKRLQFLRELVPGAAAGTIGFLINPTNPLNEPRISDVLAAAQSIEQQIRVVTASTVNEIDAAFAAAEQHFAALMVDGDELFFRQRDQMAALAARYRIPSSYPNRPFADAGGLMSYGDNRLASLRQAGIYVGRILKGDKPSDLPVMQPARLELVINMKTAKALGLTVPRTLLAAADKVIE